jgi:hypothetical protein
MPTIGTSPLVVTNQDNILLCSITFNEGMHFSRFSSYRLALSASRLVVARSASVRSGWKWIVARS